MVNKFAGEQTIRSVSMVMNLLTTTITFVSIIVLLWAVNPWIVVLIIFTTFPAAWITYKQNNETFFGIFTGQKKVRWSYSIMVDGRGKAHTGIETLWLISISFKALACICRQSL